MLEPSVEYSLDEHDKIVRVNQAWHQFYADNATGGSSASFLGQSIFNWIRGPEVRELFSYLLKTVRRRRETLILPFRCDSAQKRRYMVMYIDCEDGKNVHFQTWTLKQEAFSKPLSWSSQEPLVMCAWCNRVLISKPLGGERWTEIEDAIIELGLFQREHNPRFAHSICEDCKRMIQYEAAVAPRYLAQI